MYDPVLRLENVAGDRWNIDTRTEVAPGEGLELTSNSVSGSVRTVVYNVVNGGPGGHIDKTLEVYRQVGEKSVTVKVEKGGTTEGESSGIYE